MKQLLSALTIFSGLLLLACDRPPVRPLRTAHFTLRLTQTPDAGASRLRQDCLEDPYGEVRSPDGSNVFVESADRLGEGARRRIRRHFGDDMIDRSLIETCADDPTPLSRWLHAAYQATEHCITTFATSFADVDRIARSSGAVLISPDGSVLQTSATDESDFGRCIRSTLTSFRGPPTGLCRPVISYFPRCSHTWFRQFDPGAEVELYEFRAGQAIAAWRSDAGR